MRHETWRLRALNLVLASTLKSTKHPDRVFNRMLGRCAEQIDGFHLGPIDDLALHGQLRLLRSYAAMDLSGVGWLAARDSMTYRLQNRMHVRRLHAQNPDIAHVKIERPIFVVGLPRTATTLTHNILAAAEDSRGPLMSEMLFPDLIAPDPREEERLQRERRRIVQRRLDQTLTLSPTWNSIHPMDAGAPEEDMFMKDHTWLFFTHGDLPGYEQYLMEDYDPVADFRMLKEHLQVLSYGRPERRWVLKHPGNLRYLRALREVFPDSTIVWTHREPPTVMASMCSMAESLHYLYLKPRSVDPHAIGQRWLRILSETVKVARDEQVGLPGKPVVNVGYHQLMTQPEQRVAWMFDQLGMRWTEQDARRVREAMRAPRDRSPHRYSMARYGLEHGMVEDAFGDYIRTVAGINLRQ